MTAGALLKKAREDKRITLRQAADDTKITARHLQAIEDDNYMVFPGETYALGFLSSYAVYLDVDPEQVKKLYKGSQLTETETPLHELMQPTVQISDYLERFAKPLIIIPLVIAVIAGIVVLVTHLMSDSGTIKAGGNENSTNNAVVNFTKGSNTVPEVESDHVKLTPGRPSPQIIKKGRAINFSVQNTEVFIVLRDIVSDDKTGNYKVDLEVYPGRKKYSLKEEDPIDIEDAAISRKFKVTLSGVTANNAKLVIDLGEEIQPADNSAVNEVRVSNPDNFLIRLEGTLTGDTYVEYFVDGKPGKRGLFKKDTPLLLEANDSIQIKIGDAGDVKLTINGKPEVLGQKGHVANKIIRKVRDPVEQSKFKVVIKDA
ncbi:MAG: helix-turn-helix domain-containing protein [Turneriella sp.]